MRGQLFCQHWRYTIRQRLNGSHWVRVEKFKKNNDTGNHCSQYYNLTPYKDAVPFSIRFHTNNSKDMDNGDKLMIDDITVFAW